MRKQLHRALPWILGVGAALLPGGILLALLLRRSQRRPSAPAYPSWITHARVTRTRADADGWVQTPPRELAREAGRTMQLPGPLDVEVYTLARFIGSETGDAPIAEKIAVGWVVVNRARERRWTLLRMATHTTRRASRSLYGSQEHGRVASTARDPTDADVYVATMILADQWPDPTSGSVAFFSPHAQRILHEQWERGERSTRYRTPEEIIAKWRAEGMEPVVAAGVDPEEQLFFRRT